MTRIHVSASILALLTIAGFWTSTVITELFLGEASVVALKTTLPWGFLLLIPAMAVAGITGIKLARGRRGGVIGTKLARMKIIAANGVIVLLPSAFFLAFLAGRGEFGISFYLVQALELVAGAANLTLLGLNFRDGRKLNAGRRRRATAV
jgi:hypothetical protein